MISRMWPRISKKEGTCAKSGYEEEARERII